jgi:hypothetical protein
MYNLDTKEEVDMDVFFEALENGEVIIDGRHMTDEDHKETSRKIAEYKAMRQNNKIKEAVLV